VLAHEQARHAAQVKKYESGIVLNPVTIHPTAKLHEALSALPDRERTIVDSLRRPELMGGVRHLTDVMREYAHHPEHNYGKLTAVARDFASGAGWKRLGYLAEQLWPEQDALIAEARSRVTAGYVRLDPAVKARGSLVRRWGIQVNVVVDRHVQPA